MRIERKAAVAFPLCFLLPLPLPLFGTIFDPCFLFSIKFFSVLGIDFSIDEVVDFFLLPATMSYNAHFLLPLHLT